MTVNNPQITKQNAATFSNYPKIATFVAASACALILYINVLIRHPEPANPFNYFAGMISGQTYTTEFWSNYETLSSAFYGLACAESLTIQHCFYRPETGPFDLVIVNELNEGGDRAIYFSVRENLLTVGDLAQLWGRPSIEHHRGWLILHWTAQRMSALVRSASGRFSYFLPVKRLFFAASHEPIRFVTIVAKI